MNRMFTTCPGCRMNLAVTAPDLRVGQGYVRCGRCERVFNALLSLSEDLEPEEAAVLKATGTTSVPALPEELEEEAAGAAAPAQTPPAPAAARGATADSSVDVFDSQAAATGSFETIVLEGESFLQTEEHVDATELDQQIQQIAREMGGAPATTAASAAAPATRMTRAARDDEDQDEDDADAIVGNRPRAHWLWVVLVALLVLLLAGQLVHHNRQALVANPRLETPIKAVYGLFGVTLEPAWDLNAYDLRQLGAEAMGSATTILLRASVQNLAPHAQPPPLIRAVLQDRFGNAIATVAVLPQDYARGKVPTRLAPSQRLDAELKLADPQRQAVGFQLDVCLPAADARLHCSGEP